MYYRIKSTANNMFITVGKAGVIVTTETNDDSQLWAPIALIDEEKIIGIVIMPKVAGLAYVAIRAPNNYGPVDMGIASSSLDSRCIWTLSNSQINSVFYTGSSFSLTLAEVNGYYPDGSVVQIALTEPGLASQSWEWIPADF